MDNEEMSNGYNCWLYTEVRLLMGEEMSIWAIEIRYKFNASKDHTIMISCGIFKYILVSCVVWIHHIQAKMLCF